MHADFEDFRYINNANILYFLTKSNNQSIFISSLKSLVYSHSTSFIMSDQRTRRRKHHETYNIYIYKVLKQVHPEIGVSKRAMQVLNSFVEDVFDRICTEAGRLCQYSKKHTLGAREVQAATALVLPGELAKHAQSEGTKSVNKYMASLK
eukprot:76449_1